MRRASLRRGAAALAVCVGFVLNGCGECAGTDQCTSDPFVSATGKFIVHRTGAPVAGVQVEWVWRGAQQLLADTIRAVSDADGLFTLRVGAKGDGRVGGDMYVTPPPPYAPYMLNNVVLTASRRYGDGSYLGRFSVEPYMILVGEVHDASTGGLITSATVTIRRISGGRFDTDVVVSPLDAGGRFAWVDPVIVEVGTVVAEFSVQITGDARTFVSRHELPMFYRDGEYRPIILDVPR